MELVRLGKTELMVSRLSFGGLPIQSVDRESAAEVVRYAYNRGINFFDTARGYTTSEADIGKGLAGLGDKVIVATKSRYKDMAKFVEDFEASLNNLKRDYLDLFQFHIVNYQEELDAILAKNGPLAYLKENQKKGRLRHIGITSHRPLLMIKAMATKEFETIQIPFNFIESEPLKEVIPYALSNHIGVIVMKPLAGGVFRNNKAALGWILQHSGLVPIPGMCRNEEVDENLSALEFVPGPDEIASLEQDRKDLGSKFCRRCDYCLPCPNDIEASYIVRSGLLFERAGWDKMEQSHVDAFIKGLTCTQCGDCASRCPYELPLTDMVIDESKAMLEKASYLGLIEKEELEKKLKEAEEKRT